MTLTLIANKFTWVFGENERNSISGNKSIWNQQFVYSRIKTLNWKKKKTKKKTNWKNVFGDFNFDIEQNKSYMCLATCLTWPNVTEKFHDKFLCIQ